MAEYKNVSFATFEEDDSGASSGNYGFEFPIEDNALDGRLWVGYDFNRESARLYIDLDGGSGTKRLAFYPNYSFALLDPVTDMAANKGDGSQLVYFSDGMPIESTDTLGGPYGEGAYYTPIYLNKGSLVACAGTTVTESAQVFSGNKTFNNNINIGGSTTLSSTLTVAGNTTLNNLLEVSGATTLLDTLDVNGITTFANKLVFSGTTAATSQIHFSRTNNPSYFSAGSGGYFCFTPNGKDIGVANSDLVISDGAVYPGTTGVTSLGTASKQWSNVYATTFTGALSGNASSANKLNTSAGAENLPVYFSGGIPVVCVAEKIFSSFGRTRTSTTNTIAATICGKERTFDLTEATASYAGLLTANTQTIGGAKTFNNNVTIKGQTSLQDIIIVDSSSYGTTLPSSGVEGQVFFLLIE